MYKATFVGKQRAGVHIRRLPLALPVLGRGKAYWQGSLVDWRSRIGYTESGIVKRE